MKWLSDILTGPNNETLAIGRALGVILFICALMVLPAFLLGLAWRQKTDFLAIMGLLPTIGSYIGLVVASITGLIRLTNATEPKP